MPIDLSVHFYGIYPTVSTINTITGLTSDPLPASLIPNGGGTGSGGTSTGSTTNIRPNIPITLNDLVPLGSTPDSSLIGPGGTLAPYIIGGAFALSGIGGALETWGLFIIADDGLIALEGSEAGGVLSNPISSSFSRVIPSNIETTTLGPPGESEVFVTNTSELDGLTASQIAEKLRIPYSSTGYKIYNFPSEGIDNIATPLIRTNPGFVGGGSTGGGASEFVIPNGTFPNGTTVTIIGP